MEPFLCNEGVPKRSWFFPVTKHKALSVFIESECETSERPVLFHGDFTDGKLQ